MARAAFRHMLLGVAASGLLMGCVSDTGGGEAVPGAAPVAAAGTGREVEAPEVFQTTDSALWDGRPSLGGIWVASPDAVDPERVVMFNPATGKSVTGALFRRERDNPGPALQVSSDAAEALGMLAGQPTELRVTALRREVVEPEAVVAPPTSEPEAAATPAQAAPESDEAEAVAAAALDATGAAAEVAAEDPAAETEAEPKRKTWKERRAEAKARREAEKAAAEAAAAAEAGAAAADPVDPAASAVAEVETAPLDARAPEAAAPAAEAPPAPAPAVTAAARTIQIASFSKEENANRAVEALSKIDIAAEVRKSDRNGTPFWGVIARGDAALLAKIRDAGFADAYFLQ